jgi:ADP-ribosylglycohydrolase
MRGPAMGTIDAPLNDSKGCGGVMRAAPAGLVGERADGFDLGCETAALTHGHPSGYLAAGALAALVARLLDGGDLGGALDEVAERLASRPAHEETLDALRAARELASGATAPGPEAVAALGGGWAAEEALAIAVYCALVAPDFATGVRLAVNHSGDSDSTGAITGNLLGVLLGLEAIPPRWLTALELRAEIEQLADDWIACFVSDQPVDVTAPEWWRRYPGW